jgi:hypothetical protein
MVFLIFDFVAFASGRPCSQPSTSPVRTSESLWERAFQNENVAVTGAAQPEENTFEAVLDEDQSEIHVALAR